MGYFAKYAVSKNEENDNEIFVKVIDRDSDGANVKILHSGNIPVPLEAYSFGILLDGEHHACSGINELTLTYNRLRDEDVDDDDEDYDNDEFEMVDCIDEDLAGKFIEKAEIVSIENPNYWDTGDYDPEESWPPEDFVEDDYEEDESLMHLYPTAIIKVRVKDKNLITKFAGKEWDSYYPISF